MNLPNCRRHSCSSTASVGERMWTPSNAGDKKGVSPTMSSSPGSFLPTRQEDAGYNAAMEIPCRTNPPPPSSTAFQKVPSAMPSPSPVAVAPPFVGSSTGRRQRPIRQTSINTTRAAAEQLKEMHPAPSSVVLSAPSSSETMILSRKQ